MSRHVGRVLALAGSICVLAAAGASFASAQDDRSSVELSPCATWGDLLPVELSRDTARQAIVCLVNEERGALGLPLLEQQRRLQQASQRHTAAMNGTGCFSHQCPGEHVLRKRLARYLAGPPRRFLYGEAIAWQPPALASPRQVVDGLLTSPVHRYHLLHRKYDEVGVGFSVGTPSSSLELGGIYTIDLGMRKD